MQFSGEQELEQELEQEPELEQEQEQVTHPPKPCLTTVSAWSLRHEIGVFQVWLSCGQRYECKRTNGARGSFGSPASLNSLKVWQ